MSRHIQFESNMTLSGANADMRIPLKYDEQKLVILEIYNSLFSKKIKIDSNLSISDKLRKAIDNTIEEIKSNKKGSVVICLLYTSDAADE